MAIIKKGLDFNKLKCDDRAYTINEAENLGLCYCCDPEWKCELKRVLKNG